jgi:hypothetical protein
MSTTSGLLASAPASVSSVLTTSVPASPTPECCRIVKPILIYVCLPVAITFVLWLVSPSIFNSDLWPNDLRPGIGDNAEKLRETVKEGMTKDQVRAVLGRPHRTGDCGGDEWTYRCDFFGGSNFRVFFGSDGRVTRREWWAN